MLSRRRLSFVVPLLFLLVLATFAFSQVGTGRYVPYAGRLENSGVPVDGTVSMTFSFFAAATGGTALDASVHDVLVSGGAFAVDIGPLDEAVFTSTGLYLEISVEGAVLGERQAIRAVPFSVSGQIGEPFYADGLIASETQLVDFTSTLGDKVLLWGAPGQDRYGFGIDPGRLNVFTPQDGQVAFGRMSGTSFTPTLSIDANTGAMPANRFRAVTVINNQAGNTAQGTFTYQGGTLLLFVTASAYTSAVQTFNINVAVVGPGAPAASRDLSHYPNEVSSHKQLSQVFVFNANTWQPGTVTVTVAPGTNGIRDFNDRSNVVALELPFQ